MFIKAIISNSDFRGCELEQALFNEAKINQSNFAKAKLIQAQFTDADVSESSFDGCDLSYADFSNANLTDALISHATLFRTNLHCIKDKGTNWFGSDKTLALGTDKNKQAAENFSQ
jgi:uncharacterized protein YjbI with pentapeptide repeats